MDMNRIKDENTFKDPAVIEIAAIMVPALIGIIQIVQYHEHNRYQEIENNRYREFETQLDMIKFAVSKLESLSDEIMGLLSVAASQNRFNIDGKVTIKDTLVRLHRDEYFRYLQLENNFKKVETEIYNIKYHFRSSAIENKLNLDINGDDPLVTSFDSLILNRDNMTIGAYMTGLTDSISETSKRLAELGKLP